MMFCIERQLLMEDVEDDDNVDDWEDIEIEDDIENVVDMYSLFALKKQQIYATPQAESIRSRS